MTKRRRRGRRKQGRFITWLKNLSRGKKILLGVVTALLVLLIVLVVVGSVYISNKFNKMEVEEIEPEEIIVNEELDETVGVGYTNFVLFGGDSREGEVAKNLNTDSIIVVNLNNETKEIKLISVYRDTLLDMTNGSVRKCNAAYALGGAKQAINMLNMNLDLDIKKYVAVDFTALVDLVDMLGGLEVDVSEAEKNAVNDYLAETAAVAGKPCVFLDHAGVQTLDGAQATTYARIRKGVGDDYGRTERQREIIMLLAEKVLKSDIGTINKIIDQLFPRIATNFTLAEVLSYASAFAKYKIVDNTGFPFDLGARVIPGKGDCVYPVSLENNVSKLHEFMYGTEGYQPTNKVCSISNEIAYLVSTSYGSSSDNSSDDNAADDSPDNNQNTETTPDNGSSGETTTPGDGNTGTDDNQGSEGNTGTDDNQGSGGSTGTDDNQGSGGSTGTDDNQGSGGSTGTDDNQGSGGSTGTDDNQGSGGSTGTDDNQGSGGSTGTDDNQGSGNTSTGNDQGNGGAAGTSGTQEVGNEGTAQNL